MSEVTDRDRDAEQLDARTDADGEPDDEDGDGLGPDDDGVRSSESPDRYSTAFPLAGALLGLAAVAALLLVALVLPAAKSSPRELPVGVSGPANVQAQLVQLFTDNEQISWKVTPFTREQDLREAIENRELYGGLSLSEQGASMLVSSAASTVAADALSGFATSLQAQAQAQIPVRDVVALPEADRTGSGLASAALPLTVASILPALVLIRMYRRRLLVQVAAAVGASVLIGLVLAAVLDLVLGTTDGSNFLLVSAGLAAGVLAVSLLLLGLNAVAGRIGAIVGAAVLLLLGVPLAGLATAPEWLPRPWGALGQLLPPGAEGSLLRSTAYFDGSGAGRPLLVLGIWAAIGLLLLCLSFVFRTGDRTGAGAGAGAGKGQDGAGAGWSGSGGIDDGSDVTPSGRLDDGLSGGDAPAAGSGGRVTA